MSASLVGSEMCIRDRLLSPPTQWPICHRRPSGVFVTDEDTCRFGYAAGSVSYTHLTLPTICSV
eukprot:15260685-Alexandrium_andersonii.AAC.1